MSTNDEKRWRRYEVWIQRYVEKNPDLTALCERATAEMKEAFPELERVRGHVYMKDAPDGDERSWPHWWLVDPSSFLVDPTRDQFPCSELRYEALDESKGEPTGKCPNCSGLCYDGHYCCSDECWRDYAAYCTGRPL